MRAWTVSKQTATIIEGSGSHLWYSDTGLGWGEEAGEMMGGNQLFTLHNSAPGQFWLDLYRTVCPHELLMVKENTLSETHLIK